MIFLATNRSANEQLEKTDFSMRLMEPPTKRVKISGEICPSQMTLTIIPPIQDSVRISIPTTDYDRANCEACKEQIERVKNSVRLVECSDGKLLCYNIGTGYIGLDLGDPIIRSEFPSSVMLALVSSVATGNTNEIYKAALYYKANDSALASIRMRFGLPTSTAEFAQCIPRFPDLARVQATLLGGQ